MTDAEKLRLLAGWFESPDDEIDVSWEEAPFFLRRIASLLDAVPPETLVTLNAGAWHEMSKWRRWILEQEGLSEWKIEDSVDAECWAEAKTILIQSHAGPALFLHEVAHALTPELANQSDTSFTNTVHGWKWGDEFTRLIHKYMTANVLAAAPAKPEG